MYKSRREMYHEEKIHTPSDFPYNTYICSIPLDFRSVKPHWHDEIEIIVIKKGEGLVCVDLTSYSVKQGDIVFVFSGQLHSIEQKATLSMEYENILFKPSLLKSSGQDLCSDTFLQPLFSGRVNIPPLIDDSMECHANISSLIGNIDRLCDARPYGYQLAVKGQLFMILYSLVSLGGQKISLVTDSKSLEKIKLVLTYISENYRENITIEEIAGICYYSKSYFMKFFKKSMGVSFITFLNDYRLDIAADLIRSSNENIINIAENTGFDNLSYFNRSFKKKFGCTPGKYHGTSD